MALFKEKRSQSEGKGGGTVDEPSQVRYIQYLEKVKVGGVMPEVVPLQLRGIKIKNLNTYFKGGTIFVEVYQFKKIQDKNSWEKERIDIMSEPTELKDYGNVFDVEFVSYASVQEDIVIDFGINWKIKTDSLFRYSFHTGFIKDNLIHVVHEDLDEGYKNEK